MPVTVPWPLAPQPVQEVEIRQSERRIDEEKETKSVQTWQFFLWFVLILKKQMAGFHRIFPAESSERLCFDVFWPIQEVRRLRRDRALRARCSRERANIGTSAFHIANPVHLVTDGQWMNFFLFIFIMCCRCLLNPPFFMPADLGDVRIFLTKMSTVFRFRRCWQGEGGNVDVTWKCSHDQCYFRNIPNCWLPSRKSRSWMVSPEVFNVLPAFQVLLGQTVNRWDQLSQGFADLPLEPQINELHCAWKAASSRKLSHRCAMVTGHPHQEFCTRSWFPMYRTFKDIQSQHIRPLTIACWHADMLHFQWQRRAFFLVRGDLNKPCAFQGLMEMRCVTFFCSLVAMKHRWCLHSPRSRECSLGYFGVGTKKIASINQAKSIACTAKQDVCQYEAPPILEAESPWQAIFRWLRSSACFATSFAGLVATVPELWLEVLTDGWYTCQRWLFELKSSTLTPRQDFYLTSG